MPNEALERDAVLGEIIQNLVYEVRRISIRGSSENSSSRTLVNKGKQKGRRCETTGPGTRRSEL